MVPRRVACVRMPRRRCTGWRSSGLPRAAPLLLPVVARMHALPWRPRSSARLIW